MLVLTWVTAYFDVSDSFSFDGRKFQLYENLDSVPEAHSELTGPHIPLQHLRQYISVVVLTSFSSTAL